MLNKSNGGFCLCADTAAVCPLNALTHIFFISFLLRAVRFYIKMIIVWGFGDVNVFNNVHHWTFFILKGVIFLSLRGAVYSPTTMNTVKSSVWVLSGFVFLNQVYLGSCYLYSRFICTVLKPSSAAALF